MANVVIRPRDDEYLDDDVAALESVAYVIKQAPDTELDALSAAAKRALAVELAAPVRRDDWVNAHCTWMEDLFGGEGWVGNDRA